MVQPGIGLDTPRTNVGDATFLSNQQLDFDISQEQSFQSPSKDNNNLITQLKNGRRGISLNTPRSRAVLGDRRNLPTGGEFTPLLKSATRNSAKRGKENGLHTPGFHKSGLDNIPEDFSPLPVMGSSIYGHDSRNGSYVAGTPMPQIESSSTASTPLALLPRRNDGPGVLQDGNQLSLREQENVIDKIEKENFGLKLKIHFLEDALRKAGPGFSEAALKENTELKVDKVTMTKELYRYRKTLGSAERDVETYRKQLTEMQDKYKRKHASDDQTDELNLLRIRLEEKEVDLEQLRQDEGKFDDLQDKVQDLEAELREKDRAVNDREDEVENLKDEIEKQSNQIAEFKEALKDSQRRAVELEEKAQASEELDEAKEMIDDLERDIERLKTEAQDAKEDREEAFRQRDRAENDLEELQEELANKSISTKGLNRQIEEKASRLQDELEDLREKHSNLADDYEDKVREVRTLLDKIEDLKQENDVREQKLKVTLESVQSESENAIREQRTLTTKVEVSKTELQQKADEKDLLQARHDALTSESASLQRDLSKSRRTIEDLEDKLKHEQTLALANERDVRDEYKEELNRLHATIDSLNANMEQLKDKAEDLEAEVRQKERLYDDDSDKWDSERRSLESERDRAEEKSASLQRAIDKLQQAEGSLSGKELKLQQDLQTEKDRHASEEAVLARQIDELNADVNARRKALEDARVELLSVREELRLNQREQKTLAEKVEGLEDEVEILQTSLDDESEQANQEIATAKQESESLRHELRIMKQDLNKAESVASGAQAQMEAFRGDLQAGEGSKDQLALRLSEVGAQLAKFKDDKQALQGQVVSLKSEVHSLRVSKADLEAERDELQSQLQAMKQQEDETFRLDKERTDLRTAKMKLDAEIRRLREENNLTLAQKETLEKELQDEIDRATAEETRLSTEIHDLQKILRGSSEKRELSTAKKSIQRLEDRIKELESQIASADGHIDHTDVTSEISSLRQDLAAARHKETEYLQREASTRDVLRGLKRQIAELERKAHNAEVSRLAVSSPHSSASGSARKSEINEIRLQLAAAHQTLKDLRSQVKEVEKDAARKIKAANVKIQAQNEAWETEKDQLERSLDEALLLKEELVARNSASEATVTRLRNKIQRLEQTLQTERQNSGEDRTMAFERRDLHEMLRETQVQAETLELVIKDRDTTIAAITATGNQLRASLKRVKDERALHRSKAVSAQEQVEKLAHKYTEAKQALEAERTLHQSKAVSTREQLERIAQKYTKAKEAWAAERKTLTTGVRFPNMSLSVNDESQLLAERSATVERERQHVREMRGMKMQAEWLRAKCRREEDLRDCAAYAKRYMEDRIKMFEACNKEDLTLLRATVALTGRPFIEPEKPVKKTTFRIAIVLVRATVRMKMQAAKWAVSRKIHDDLAAKREEQEINVIRKQISDDIDRRRGIIV